MCEREREAGGGGVSGAGLTLGSDLFGSRHCVNLQDITGKSSAAVYPAMVDNNKGLFVLVYN